MVCRHRSLPALPGLRDESRLRFRDVEPSPFGLLAQEDGERGGGGSSGRLPLVQGCCQTLGDRLAWLEAEEPSGGGFKILLPEPLATGLDDPGTVRELEPSAVCISLGDQSDLTGSPSGSGVGRSGQSIADLELAAASRERQRCCPESDKAPEVTRSGWQTFQKSEHGLGDCERRVGVKTRVTASLRALVRDYRESLSFWRFASGLGAWTTVTGACSVKFSTVSDGSLIC